MSVLCKWVVVTSSAAVSVHAAGTHSDLWLSAASGTIYLGSSGVSSTNGLALTTGTDMARPAYVRLFPGDTLYAITAAASTMQVLIRY